VLISLFFNFHFALFCVKNKQRTIKLTTIASVTPIETTERMHGYCKVWHEQETTKSDSDETYNLTERCPVQLFNLSVDHQLHTIHQHGRVNDASRRLQQQQQRRRQRGCRAMSYSTYS